MELLGYVVGGLTGYGVLSCTGAMITELGQTAAAFAVGGAVTMIPASLAILCIGIPLAACAIVYCKDEEVPSDRPRV